MAGERFRFFAGGQADRLRLAALGDLPRDVVEGLAALVGEVEGHRRLPEFVGFLPRVGDLGAREGGFVVERVPAPVLLALDRLAVGVVRLFGDDDRAHRHLQHLALASALAAVDVDVEVFDLVLGAGDQFVRVAFLEQVVARLRRRAGRAVRDRRLLGAELHRPVGVREGAREDQLFVEEPLRWPPRFLPFLFGRLQRPRRRFAAGVAADRLLAAEQVRLPVVEVELRGGADPFGRPFRFGDVGEADRDLGFAEARDLRLGDAQLVDSFADDLDRGVDVRSRDFRHLPGRGRLVDELDAPLQVEAEAGLLVGDDDAREDGQPEHEEQYEEMAAPLPHVPRLSSPA